MFGDPIIKNVNYLLKKSKKTEKKIKRVLLSYTKADIKDISHEIKIFEEICRDKKALESMKLAAEKENKEFAQKLLELSLKNTRAILELRKVAEEKKIESVKSREEAISLIEIVFGSAKAYIQLLDETISMEENLSKKRQFILRIYSQIKNKRYRSKLEKLEKELLYACCNR
jgi:uncharacterized protein (UPF0147 family)